MQMRPTDRIQAQLAGIAHRIGPVLAAVTAALFIILGILIINYPELLSWVVGIALVLAGVGLLAATITVLTRTNP